MTSPCDKPKRETEADIQQAIRLALGLEPDLVLWRNNVGGTIHEASSRVVQYGVGGKGGSDLLGILGPNGRWFALEVKKPGGRVKQEQLDFLAIVRSMGGFGAVVYSVDDARAALARARRGESE